ncbi:MAG TPA: PepSY domain-containing protein [Methylomirabilota bacterium]|jgi:hypothetical protein
MRAIERIVGVTIGTVVLAAAGPALAAPAEHSPTIAWTTAGAVAAERVPGSILNTKLEDNDGHAVYTVDIRTADNRIEEVQVDAHSAKVLGVHDVSDPGLAGELEAP